MKILLLGFGAFPGVAVNFTGQLVQDVSTNFDDDTISVDSFVLPVIFSESEQLVRLYIDRTAPDFIVIAGIKRKAKEINLERVAVNILHSYGTDAAGKTVKDSHIYPGAQEGFFCPLNLSSMAEMLSEKNIPARVTFHAGTYVCNQVYYYACSMMKKVTGSPNALLVHFPLAVPEDQKSPCSEGSILYSNAVRALNRIVRSIPHLLDMRKK